MRKKIFALIILVLCILASASCNPCKDSRRPSYFIDMDFDIETMQAAATEQFTYTNTTDCTLNSLAFHLYPNAFSESAEQLPVTDRHKAAAYYNGVSYGGIEILRVEGDSPLDFEVDKEMLFVEIPDLKQGKSITFNIRFKLTMPAVNHRFGYTADTVNMGNFYPQLAVFEDGAFRMDRYYPIGDPFYSEMANYKVKLKIDKDYKAAATGAAVKESLNIDTSTYTFEADNVRDFAMVLSDKFTVINNHTNGININYYYLSDPLPENSLNTACSSIAVFSDIIGKYPYGSYTVAETNFVYGGMEYPQLVMIASDLAANTREKVIVHETAHQWLYGLIGNDSIREAWIDEGLTEFMTALYYEEIGQTNIKKELVNQSFNAYIMYNNVYRTVGSVDTSMAKDLSEFASEYEYVTMVYTKGLLMFNTIYEIIGKDDFVKGMKNYYKKNCCKTARGEDLISEFNKVSKKKTAKIFEAWLYGKVVVISA